MLNPDDLSDQLAAAMLGIADLRSTLGGAQQIFVYKDAFPGSSNLRQAILQQPLGTILVVFMGTDKARFPNDRSGGWSYRHKFSFMVRAGGAGSYGAIWAAFVNGLPVPALQLTLMQTEINPGCDPMDREGPISQRNSLLVSVDGATLDYFEFQATLIEKGA